MGKIKKNVKWAETAATTIFHQSPTSPDRPSPIQRLRSIRRRINRPANPRSAALPSIFRSCRSSASAAPRRPSFIAACKGPRVQGRRTPRTRTTLRPHPPPSPPVSPRAARVQAVARQASTTSSSVSPSSPSQARRWRSRP